MKTNAEACSISQQKDEWGLFRIMGGNVHPKCPNESELLAFHERDLSSWKKARIEKHLGECESCRESIAMIVILGREANQERGETLGIVAEDVIGTQVARIVTIARDDEVRRAEATRSGGLDSFVPARPRTMLGIPLSRRLMLAMTTMVFILLAVPVIFWMVTRPSPSQQARQSLLMANRPGRHSEAVVSGLQYSPDTTTRGAASQDNLMFDRAESKVLFASDPSAKPEARHMLARVWLARNAVNDARNALGILSDLVSRGVASPEVLNDLGVAQFELSKYDEAIASFNKALQASPAFREALFNRAVAEKANAQNSEAVRSFQEFLNTNPEADWRAEVDRDLRGLDIVSPSPR